MPNDDKTPGLGPLRTTTEKGEVERLSQDLRDFNDQVREKAVNRLGEIRDRQALPLLIGRLTNDKSPRVRFYAAHAIYQIGDAQAWSQLIPVLSSSTEENESVRAKVVEILGLIEDKRYSKKVVEALSDLSEKVWKQAVWSLGKLKDPAIIQDLITGLAGPTPRYRPSTRCVEALVAMGSMVAGEVLSSAEILSENAGVYKETGKVYILSEDYYTAYAAFYQDRVDVLSRLGASAISTISKQYSPKSKFALRVIATRSLSAISDAQSRSLLCQIVQKDESPAIRWLALSGLGEQFAAQPDFIEETILGVLQQDKEWRLRLRAIELLAQVNSTKAVKPFCSLAISDPNGDVRFTAILSLGKLRDVQATTTLATILLDNPDPSYRALAAETMGVIGSGEALPHLLSALGSDRNVAVRKVSAEALVKIKDRRAIKYLKAVTTSDPSEEVRQIAKNALAQFR